LPSKKKSGKIPDQWKLSKSPIEQILKGANGFVPFKLMFFKATTAENQPAQLNDAAVPAACFLEIALPWIFSSLLAVNPLLALGNGFRLTVPPRFPCGSQPTQNTQRPYLVKKTAPTSKSQ